MLLALGANIANYSSEGQGPSDGGRDPWESEPWLHPLLGDLGKFLNLTSPVVTWEEVFLPPRVISIRSIEILCRKGIKSITKASNC